LKEKQQFLLKLKENASLLEESKKSVFSKGVQEKITFEMTGFKSLDNWEDFLVHCCKNEHRNNEEGFMKILKEILYKIEMSTIVYENILSEIDEYELMIKLREGNLQINQGTIDNECQGKKEKIGVMEENFLGNLKELKGKM